MFWSQEDENSINDLLIREDVTLEEVLDHESILQECKVQNEHLIKFLCKQYYNLINYILITPSDGINELLRFKYPSLICEVLTSDAPEINDLLVKGSTDESNNSNNNEVNTVFVQRLLDKFENDATINPLTLSFLIRILLNILKSNNEEVMNYILRRKNSINLFLKHVENNAIVVFFSEFLMCDDEYAHLRIEWLRREDFVLKCSRMFAVIEYRNNSVQALLCEVIGTSWRFFSNKDMREEIRSQLNGQEFLDVIFGHLANPKSDCNLITSCLKVVRTIVDFEIDSEDRKLNLLKDMILKHFNSLIILLSTPPKQLYDPMPTTIGRIAPFGPTRLEIVYFLESLLRLKDSDITQRISQTNIFMVLITFVSQYKWNTLFQLGLLRIFDIVFTDLSTNCQFRTLIEHLVTDYDIYHWFIERITEIEKLEDPRPGSMGLLWKIGNHLNSLWCSELSGDLISKGDEDSGEWAKIVDGYLSPRNKENVITPPKIDSGFRDMDIKVVDIDEDDSFISTNPDLISKMFENKSDNLNDIFGATTTESCDDWIENELSKSRQKPFAFSGGGTGDEDDEEEDSSSDDEVSPAIIRQKSDGTAAKYLLSDLPNSNDLQLFDVPELSPATTNADIKFEDFWKLKSSPDSSVNNWADFNM